MSLEYTYNKAKESKGIGVNEFYNFVESGSDELNGALKLVSDAEKKDEIINNYDTIRGMAKALKCKSDEGGLYEPVTGSYKVWTHFIEVLCNEMTRKDNLPSVRLFFNRIGKLNRVLKDSLNLRLEQ